MSDEIRRFIRFAFELVLLGGIVTFVIISGSTGKDSLSTYIDNLETKDRFPVEVAHTKGTVGYYELIDLIDFYAPLTDIVILYKDEAGMERQLNYTKSLDGKTVKLVLGDLPKQGVPYTGTVYGRSKGELYKSVYPTQPDGFIATSFTLEADMHLRPNSISGIDKLGGSGVLDYEFTEALFWWLKDARFICTVQQVYENSKIESITLQMR